MKSIFALILGATLFSTIVLAEESVGQVQLCDGTEAAGSEGQGMAVSLMLNYSISKDYQTNAITRKCELGVALAYEYGNDRGLTLGKATPFNVYPAPQGKTNCAVSEEGGEVYLTLTKTAGKTPKVLVDRCKVTGPGF